MLGDTSCLGGTCLGLHRTPCCGVVRFRSSVGAFFYHITVVMCNRYDHVWWSRKMHAAFAVTVALLSCGVLLGYTPAVLVAITLAANVAWGCVHAACVRPFKKTSPAPRMRTSAMQHAQNKRSQQRSLDTGVPAGAESNRPPDKQVSMVTASV